MELLSNKIINGRSGTWGVIAMSAHPQISKEKALLIVDYILSLSETKEIKSLPLTGALRTGKEEKGHISLRQAMKIKEV